MLKPGQSLPGFEARRLPGQAQAFWGEAPEMIAGRDLVSRSPAFLAVVKRDCPTCLYALPYFERLYRLHGGLVPVILLAQENEIGAAKMVENNQLEIPVLLDEEPHSIGEELEVSFVPAALLVSSGGENRVELRVIRERGSAGDSRTIEPGEWTSGDPFLSRR